MTPAQLDAQWPTDATPIHVAAEMYARMGLSPVPLHGVVDGRCTCGREDCGRAVGKHPVDRDWQRLATTDLEAVRQRFAAHRGNIGIMLGRDLVVIDVDGDDGFASLPDLGELPPTLTGESGSGVGQHLVYRYGPDQDPAEVTNRRVAPGVDVKTRAGQIVAPPSIHASGRRYRWSLAMAPATLPDHVYQAIRRPVVLPMRTPASRGGGDLYRRAAAYVARIPPAISGSGGHAQAFAAARAIAGWVRRGLSRSDAWALLCAYNRTCQPPWSERELQHKLSSALTSAQSTPDLPDRDPPTRHHDAHAPVVAAGVAPVDTANAWRAELVYDRGRYGDRLAKTAANVAIVLQHHPAWEGRVRLDLLLVQVVLDDPPWHDHLRPSERGVRPWCDEDAPRLQDWCKREFGVDVPIADCERGARMAAAMRQVHPVRDYLMGLQWDGVQRIRTMPERLLGAQPSRYVEAVWRWWMISAVARAMAPGCKVDTMIVLEGSQGARKSSALAALAGRQWFSDSAIDLRSKDAYLQLRGAWILEFAEMEAFDGASAARAKAFLTSPCDSYRQPYGRSVISVPRGCVFAGSINSETYLGDPTGGRRYWPIRCGSWIDLEGIEAERDQAWAEAMAAYTDGASWWPTTPEERAMCHAEQEDRAEQDAWHDRIASYLYRSGGEVTTRDVLESALGLEVARCGQAEQRRVVGVLTRLGWRVSRRREATGRRTRTFIRGE